MSTSCAPLSSSYRTRMSPMAAPFSGRRCITESAVTLLPLPDSPTMPSFSPGIMENDTPCTTSFGSFVSVEKAMRRFETSRTAPVAVSADFEAGSPVSGTVPSAVSFAAASPAVSEASFAASSGYFARSLARIFLLAFTGSSVSAELPEYTSLIKVTPSTQSTSTRPGNTTVHGAKRR